MNVWAASLVLKTLLKALGVLKIISTVETLQGWNAKSSRHFFLL
jgi:hypothetical protein